VVAYALAGNVLVDLVNEPWEGTRRVERLLEGRYANDGEISAVAASAILIRSSTAMLSTRMSFGMKFSRWRRGVRMGHHLHLHPEPPYFESFSRSLDQVVDIINARPWQCLEMVTTDHISPAGAIKASSSAGVYPRVWVAVRTSAAPAAVIIM